MVVHHFDLLRVAVLPNDADPVLIVDPDAVLAQSIAGECFEMAARERAQVVEPLRRVKLQELALRHPGNAPEPPRRVALKERFRIAAPEGPDHLSRVLRDP